MALFDQSFSLRKRSAYWLSRSIRDACRSLLAAGLTPQRGRIWPT
jgi:hypothetical protein